MSSIDLQCGALINIAESTEDLKYFVQQIQLPSTCPSATNILAKLIFDGPIPSLQSMIISAVELTDAEILHKNGDLKSCEEIKETVSEVSCPQGVADGATGLQYLIDIPGLQTSSQYVTILNNEINVGSLSFGAFDGNFGGYQSGTIQLYPGQYAYHLIDSRAQFNQYLSCEMNPDLKDDCEMTFTWSPLNGSGEPVTADVSGDSFTSEEPLVGGAYYALTAVDTGVGQCEATCSLTVNVIEEIIEEIEIEEMVEDLYDAEYEYEMMSSKPSNTMSIEMPCGDQSTFRPGSGWTQPLYFQQMLTAATECATAPKMLMYTEFIGTVPMESEQTLVISNTELTNDMIIDGDRVRLCSEIKRNHSNPEQILCVSGTVGSDYKTVQYIIDVSPNTIPFSPSRFMTVLHGSDSISKMAVGLEDGVIGGQYAQREWYNLNIGETGHFLMDMNGPQDCPSGSTSMMTFFCEVSDQTHDQCVMDASFAGVFTEVKGSFESEDPIASCHAYSVEFNSRGQGPCQFQCWYAPEDKVNHRAIEYGQKAEQSTTVSCGGVMMHIGALMLMVCLIKALFKCCKKACSSSEEVVEEVMYVRAETAGDDYRMI